MPTQLKTRLLDLPYRANSLGYAQAVIERPYPVLLSSADSPLGRYDIVTADPAAVIALNDQVASGITEIASAIATYCSAGDPSIELPFVAGAIGLLAYQAGEQLLAISDPAAAQDLRWPALHAGIYQWALVQDHQRRRCMLVADPKLAEASWQELCVLLAGVNETADATDAAAGDFALTSDWQCSLPLPAYRERFARLQDYIRAGDCYQANLTREFCANYRGDPWPLFRQMRKVAAAPFSAFLRRPEADLLSASPERFIHVKNAVATSQPIKGSRPRGRSASEDAARIAELVASEKDRAENLMIVDLIRNDFGRCCTIGSVSVPELFNVQSFSNVHHLVSTVRGELPGQEPGNALALLAACMPGGSVTGAPKKRAMEIIAELEPHRRSVYCGALFYLNRDGTLDSNILIRSLLFERDDSTSPSNAAGPERKVYCWSGGGIVADSDCEEEFAESDYKVAHLLALLSRSG